MTKNKQIVIQDAYEETTSRSCSSCNLALKHTFLAVLVVFLFIYLGKTDAKDTSPNHVSDDVKLVDSDFLGRVKEMFQNRKKRKMDDYDADGSQRVSVFNYIKDCTLGEYKASTSKHGNEAIKKRRKRNVSLKSHKHLNSDLVRERRRAEEGFLELQHKYKKPSVVSNGNGTIIIPSIPSPIEERHWPWSVDIYVDGRLVCIGVLLNSTCVITKLSCMSSVNLEFDYVTVVVGKSPAFMNVRSEQVHRVTCFVKMDGGNSVLLFLEEMVPFNLETQSIFLPETIDLTRSGQCFALSHNKFGKMVSRQLTESDKECFDKFRCFTNGRIDHSSAHFDCDGDEVTQCGVVMCSKGESSNYLMGFYLAREGLCVFDKVLPVQTLESIYQAIQHVINNQAKYCDTGRQPPVCNGHRCLLGACLKEDKICNGRFDCQDGSDESEAICSNHGKEPPERSEGDKRKCLK